MKQFNFSSLIAIVAVLLCFYAFSGERATSPLEGQKEYCMMRVYPKKHPLTFGVYIIYPDGQRENFPLDQEEPLQMKLVNGKINALAAKGWILKEATIASFGDQNTQEYLFERPKQ